MLVNHKLAVVGDRVVLVPYRHEHVPTYNAWMQSPSLRDLTASEPLTLQEEYEMCETWSRDDDKLTFIVLERDLSIPVHPLEAFQKAHGTDRMIGDVNMFFSPLTPPPSPSPDPTSTTIPHKPQNLVQAELELMIASSAHRNRGFGSAALRTFLSFARSEAFAQGAGVEVGRWFVRVGMGNKASLRTFEKMGFVRWKEVPVFQEVELRWPGEGKEGRVWPWEGEEGWKTQVVEWP